MEINRKIERFLRLHDMAPTTFGREAANDPRLVHDMRRGRCLGQPMTVRVLAYMAEFERAKMSAEHTMPCAVAA